MIVWGTSSTPITANVFRQDGTAKNALHGTLPRSDGKVSIKLLCCFHTITIKMYCKTQTNLIHSRYGPLSCWWCMRFKAKNSYFNTIGQWIGNFKDISKTVTTVHVTSDQVVTNWLVVSFLKKHNHWPRLAAYTSLIIGVHFHY